MFAPVRLSPGEVSRTLSSQPVALVGVFRERYVETCRVRAFLRVENERRGGWVGANEKITFYNFSIN
jgi:hypothetical protein